MIREFAEKIEYEVPEVLQDLVVGFVMGKSENAVNETVPMYPSGYSMLFNIYGDKPYLSINGKKQPTKSRLIVAGQIRNENINFHIDGNFGQVGVILYPTANYYLFHKTGVDFLNTWRTLQESSPIDTKELLQNLAAVNTIKERVLHLIKFLTLLEKQRRPSITWLEACLLKIFEKNGNVLMDELVEESKYTARHFRRVFRKVIGVSPKYYCKVIQLSTVFELLNNSEEVKIHHLALDCGYYDQSHFIHDFQKLIGDSPDNFLNGKHSYLKQYLRRRGVD